MDPVSEIHSLKERLGVAISTYVHGQTILDVRLKHIESALEKLVTRHEFTPIARLVYGIAALILSGALGAMLSRIFVK